MIRAEAEAAVRRVRANEREIRRPKAETRKKVEIRNPKAACVAASAEDGSFTTLCRFQGEGQHRPGRPEAFKPPPPQPSPSIARRFVALHVQAVNLERDRRLVGPTGFRFQIQIHFQDGLFLQDEK